MSIVKEKTVGFSGHRSEKLPKTTEGIDNLKIKVYDEIEKAIKEGVDTFIMGGCYGFDLLCAEMVLLKKTVANQEEAKNMRLIATIPFEEQATKWSEENRDKYFSILEMCDEVIYTNKQYCEDCYKIRNRFMVDNSSLLICYYNGTSGGTGYTVNYAKQQQCRVINLFQ